MNGGKGMDRRRAGRFGLWGAALALALFAIPQLASAHLERPSYWPDPGARQLGHARRPAARCRRRARSRPPSPARAPARSAWSARARRRGSLTLLAALGPPRQHEWLPPASEPRSASSAADEGRQDCSSMNQALRQALRATTRSRRRSTTPATTTGSWSCPAATRSAKSRRRRSTTPTCNPSLLQEDQSGAQTPSYEYQATCPNDQNLIYVQGRTVKGDPLPAPDPDRHGIPEQELGECVRCNLQIEGSGVQPEDVLLDAGRGYENADKPGARPGGDTPGADCLAAPDGPIIPATPSTSCCAPTAPTASSAATSCMRGAKEHGFYTEETDGILLDKVKFFWNADYGHLSLHDRPQRGQELRRVRLRRRRRLPGRLAADRRVPRRVVLPRRALQHGDQELRPARLRDGLLGLDGQLGAGHPQPLLRERQRAHERHDLRSGPSRLPGRRHEGRPQLVLLEQPRRLPRGPAVRAPGPAGRSAPGSCGRA